MAFNFANLTRWLVLAGSAVAAVYSAEAQDAGRRPGQAILFSSPDVDDVSSNVLSLAAKPPGVMRFGNAVQSPAFNFNTALPPESLPAPPTRSASPAQSQQMQRLLDERKNWALLTPEEILGVPTREKILGVPDRDAFGQPKNETVVVQYYERQERLRARTNNYDYNSDYGSDMTNLSPNWDFTGGREAKMNPNIWNPAGNRQDNPTLLDQFLGRTPNRRAESAQTADSVWPKPFNLAALSSAPTPEQQAAMEQFQQLLQPRPPSGDGAKTPALGRSIFSPLPTALNPAPGQVGSIQIGASFTPLSSGMAIPAGVTPLPGILGQTNPALSTIAPEWKPPAPPWMSSTPQLGVIPQRKF